MKKVKQRKCWCCGINKTEDRFYGEAYICKPCNNIRLRDYYRSANGQKIKERMPMILTEKMARTLLELTKMHKKDAYKLYSKPNNIIYKLERFLEFYNEI